jgi:hypothetical protein
MYWTGSRTCWVVKLLSTQDRTRVIGVQTRNRTEEGHAITTTLPADLVVDASGRHSQAPQWLMELGYEAPPVETINSNLRYASRFYARPDQFAAEWQSLVVNEGPPHGHAGFILAVDNERWHVTVGGMAGTVPPIDEIGYSMAEMGTGFAGPQHLRSPTYRTTINTHSWIWYP